MAGLEERVNDAGMRLEGDVLAVAAERFERRLGQEIGALRVDIAKDFASVRTDVAKEFSAVRTDMANEFAAVRADMANEFASVRTDMASEFAVVRTEMARMQTELMKWSFLFWVGQVAAMTAITALLLRTLR